LFKFVPDKFVLVKILPLKAQVLWYGAVFYGKVAIGFVNTTPNYITISDLIFWALKAVDISEND
jgi:hypothetical protein